MSFKPNSAVIIGALTIVVLYGIMKYAAPDQLANLTEKVSNLSKRDQKVGVMLPILTVVTSNPFQSGLTFLYGIMRYSAPYQFANLIDANPIERLSSRFKSELALGDKLPKPGSISNPLQSELMLEDILPANDGYKADANTPSKYEIAGFFLGQDEASAPCQPEFVITYNEDGTPRAKSKQCTIRDSSSKTIVYFYNNRVVGIESLVYIKKTNIDNILILLNSKFVDADDRNVSSDKLDRTKSDIYAAHIFEANDGDDIIHVAIEDCLTQNNWCRKSSEDFDFPIKSEDKFLINYNTPFLGDRTITQLSEIPLTTQEYNIEAKKIGLPSTVAVTDTGTAEAKDNAWYVAEVEAANAELAKTAIAKITASENISRELSKLDEQNPSIVIAHVKKAAQNRDFEALRYLMTDEFSWTLGDPDYGHKADFAIKAWREDKSYLEEMQSLLSSVCYMSEPKAIECPGDAGSYRAYFKYMSNGWRMTVFIAGD